MPVWPATLPQKPLLSDFERQAADRTIRSEVDAGPAIVRRRFHRGVDEFPWSAYLTDAQRATFESFHDVSLEGGALAFDMPSPEDGTTIEVRIVPRYRIAKRKADQHLLALSLEQMP